MDEEFSIVNNLDASLRRQGFRSSESSLPLRELGFNSRNVLESIAVLEQKKKSGQRREPSTGGLYAEENYCGVAAPAAFFLVVRAAPRRAG